MIGRFYVWLTWHVLPRHLNHVVCDPGHGQRLDRQL